MFGLSFEVGKSVAGRQDTNWAVPWEDVSRYIFGLPSCSKKVLPRGWTAKLNLVCHTRTAETSELTAMLYVDVSHPVCWKLLWKRQRKALDTESVFLQYFICMFWLFHGGNRQSIYSLPHPQYLSAIRYSFTSSTLTLNRPSDNFHEFFSSNFVS
jgi:hypothetical protein